MNDPMKPCLFVFSQQCRGLVLLSCAVLLCGVQMHASEQPLRLLWLGSSSLYYHNQPKVLAEWLTQHAATLARSAIAGRSGTGVHVYLRDGFKAEYGLKPGQTIRQKIADDKFDYVVLQVPAEFINGPEGEEFDRSLDIYCKAIRAAGGEPVFYEMGWGHDDKAAVGRRKIFAAAVRNRVLRFAPCSTAWNRVRRERPDLDLHNPPDQVHPGTLGSFLNLCCFHAVFTGRQPTNMPVSLTIWPRLSDDEKKAADVKVRSATLDDYDAALAGWMKRLAVSAQSERISPEVARYLERVAWEEYQQAQQRLGEAIRNAGKE